MAGPKKRKPSSSDRMPSSHSSVVTSAIESFFEDKDFEKLFKRIDDSRDEEELLEGTMLLDDLEAELFDAIGELEDFDFN